MLSLAARLRPRRFDQIIGQDLIVKIVQTALEKGKLSNACLFAGPAGTGKTTFARVVANWLVCTNKVNNTLVDEKSSQHLQACLKCSNCLAFAQDAHPDIFEFDAASHTGIDDVKNCLEGMYYQTQLANCKIYIIDEVHMLSKSAISALLKTIEEPQENVWFFLATTEQDKIPETIISRCLTLKLEKVSTAEIAKYLQQVSLEQIKSDKLEQMKTDSLAQMDSDNKVQHPLDIKLANIIATAANGCVRAALSYLDQVLLLLESNAYQTQSDNLSQLTEQSVRQIVHMPFHDQLEQIYNSLSDPQALNLSISQALSTGVNPYLLVMQLLDLAQEKSDMHTALQLGYVLEELAYSPCPDKVLSVFLWKAQYLKTLPSPQILWDAVKSDSVKSDPVKSDHIKTNSIQTDSLKTHSIQTHSMQSHSSADNNISSNTQKNNQASFNNQSDHHSSNHFNNQSTNFSNNASTNALLNRAKELFDK